MTKPTSKIPAGNLAKPVLILVVLLCLSCFCLTSCGSSAFGQSEQTFKDAFVSQGLDTKGVASNDFVKETPYSMTAFSVSGIEKSGDNKATAKATATIENESFASEIVYKCTYTDNKDNPSYSFELESSSTTPKKGIDYDSSHQLYDCDSVLSDDKASCTVSINTDCDEWFVESKNNATYTYKFDGEHWQYADKDESRSVKYKDINGDYAAKSGNAVHFSKFEISDLDSDKGTFVISFTTEEYARGTVTILSTSGTMKAAIEPQLGGDKALDDGYSYVFEASGNSNSGTKQASLKGCFTVNSTGEKSIAIEKGGFIGADSSWNGTIGNAGFEIGEATMYKQ